MLTGNFFLDSTLLALSLFNTCLTLWLGLTVLLNAERRSLGTWLTGGSLLLSAVFFISHSALVGRGAVPAGLGLEFWWRVGWLPLLVLPGAWYGVVLWYAGYWELEADGQPSALRHRHRSWLLGAALLFALVSAFGLFANPLPTLTQLSEAHLVIAPPVRGLGWLSGGYGLYILLCTGLALDALWRPGPAARVMAPLARQRARPWLIGVSVVLLAVSGAVAALLFWLARTLNETAAPVNLLPMVAWLDLALSALLAVGIGCLGQALVAYEIFTGKALPRRGLLRYWRNALILSAGFSSVVGVSLVIQLRPVYALLLATVLLILFYALVTWRSYLERERAMHQLRPFVVSQELYAAALTDERVIDIRTPFQALCRDVLGARRAVLAATGALAPLVGEPLRYGFTTPALLPEPPPPRAAQTLCLPLSPEAHGLHWAVPLWSERGLLGWLFLGEKVDGGLYTQEEIELARASGERLLDTQASAELARRLMMLQRARLAESQLLEQRPRRVLHDEVLPRLHALILQAPPDQTALLTELTALHHQLADLLRALPTPVNPELARLGLWRALQQLVNVELTAAFDEVVWETTSEAEAQARALPPLTAEVIYHAAREALRNAARHGRRPAGPLMLQVALTTQPVFQLKMMDNGPGAEALPHTTHTGQGLALHSTLLAVVGGTLTVEQPVGGGTQVVITLAPPPPLR